jgi:hypothetical protein
MRQSKITWPRPSCGHRERESSRSVSDFRWDPSCSLQLGSSLDLQLGDRPLVRVLASQVETLPSYEGTWYVSIAADDEFAGGIARGICGALSITALVSFSWSLEH